MKTHPYADLFPMFTPSELVDLADDIKENGLEHPVITFEGKILDGRNRYEACKMAKVEPKTREYKGKDALGYVIRHNLKHRRHLSVALRAEIAANVATMSHGGDRSKASNDALTTQDEAARLLGVSRSSVTRAKKKKLPPEAASWTVEDLKKNDELMDLFTAISAVYGNDHTRAIRTGTIGLKLADIRMLAKLPKEKMLEIKDLIMEEHWTPKRCLDFLNKMPVDDTTLEEMRLFCLGLPEKELVVDLNGFRHTCVPLSRVKKG